MNKEKFKIIQYIRELIVYIDKSMDNFPKKDIELKYRIRSNSYEMWTTTTTTGCGVRLLASINCGYTIIDCIRDNIETNYVL